LDKTIVSGTVQGEKKVWEPKGGEKIRGSATQEKKEFPRYECTPQMNKIRKKTQGKEGGDQK